MDKLSKEHLIRMIPQTHPFRFIDEIIAVSDESICGTYQFKKDEYFYQGHFPNNPVTPGAILTEAMAQIGLLAFGIYLYERRGESIRQKEDLTVFLASSETRFYKVVYPGEKILVSGEKVFFKHNVIKCKITVTNRLEEVVCRGTLSGMFLLNSSK